MNTVELALGGGGVRGVAHVKVLERLDARGIPVSRIAGTSMGALVGALYASGKSGREVADLMERHLADTSGGVGGGFRTVMRLLRWGARWFQPNFKGTGLVRTEKLFEYLLGVLDAETFEDLEIPLTVIATDFHTGEEHPFSSGPLVPALMASMAVPGVFPAVEVNGRYLVDGSFSNCVPFDHLKGGGTVLAIDVSPARRINLSGPPKAWFASQRMVDLLIDRCGDLRRTRCPPDGYFRGDFTGIRVMDFDKIDEVFRQCEPMLDEMDAFVRATNRAASSPDSPSKFQRDHGHRAGISRDGGKPEGSNIREPHGS